MPIIPLGTYEPDPRDMPIYDIADIIEAAVSDPAEIGVLSRRNDRRPDRGESDLS